MDQVFDHLSRISGWATAGAGSCHSPPRGISPFTEVLAVPVSPGCKRTGTAEVNE